jgi:hypothetical protein
MYEIINILHFDFLIFQILSPFFRCYLITIIGSITSLLIHFLNIHNLSKKEKKKKKPELMMPYSFLVEQMLAFQW